MPSYPSPVGFYAVATANSGVNGSSGRSAAIIAVFDNPSDAVAKAEAMSSATPFVIFYVLSANSAFQSFISLPPEETDLTGGSGS